MVRLGFRVQGLGFPYSLGLVGFRVQGDVSALVLPVRKSCGCPIHDLGFRAVVFVVVFVGR